MWGLSPQREHFETAKLAGSTDLKIFWVSQQFVVILDH